MPNHIKNVVEFEGDALKVKEIKQFMGNTPDFNKLIPMPTELDGTKSPSDLPADVSKELCRKYGADNWYDWRLEHWDTKWNAYQLDEDRLESDSGKCVFYTAWSMPMKIALALSLRFPDVKIIWSYADEDIGNNCGEIVFQGGGIVKQLFGDEDFAEELWGWQKNDDYNNPAVFTITKKGDDDYEIEYKDEAWSMRGTKAEILTELSEHLDLVEN